MFESIHFKDNNMFNVKNFMDDYNISYITEGKNTQQGWLNINCPFCNDPSQHGGFNIYTGHYNCWNCGHHWQDQVIEKLLGITNYEARNIIEQYETVIGLRQEKKKLKFKNKTSIKLPKGTYDLQPMHRKYLIKRNFDPDKIESIWNIRGTHWIGEYSYRIIAPIFLNNKIVSYIGRDITEKSNLRYKACKIENEIIHYKHIVYGADYIKDRKAIIVEGITDVWRFGKGAIAMFGTNYTKQQILFLTKLIDKAFIIFDKGAYLQTKKLCEDLIGLLSHVEIITLPDFVKDPAELTQKDADDLKKELLGFI